MILLFLFLLLIIIYLYINNQGIEYIEIPDNYSFENTPFIRSKMFDTDIGTLGTCS